MLGRRAIWNRFAADYAPPSATTSSSRASTCSTSGSATATPRWRKRVPLWFTGASTPDACEPAFAALIARGTITTADRRARFRLASEAGNVKLAQSLGNDLRRRTASPIARLPTSIAIRSRALAKGNFAWTTTQRPRSRAVRARARGARRRRRAREAPGSRWRDRLPEADRKYGNARLAYYAARQLHPSANDWFREAGDAPLTAPKRRRGGCAPRCARSRWDDVLAAHRRDARGAAPGSRMALLAGTRADASGSRETRPRELLTALADRDELLRRARARVARPAIRRAREHAARAGARRARRFRRARGRASARSSSPSSTCAPSRSASGPTSCAACRRRDPAARRRSRAPGRPLRPRDQYRGAHAGTARFRPALSRAVPQRVRGRGQGATTSTSRCCTASRGRSRASTPTSCRSAGAVGLMQLMPRHRAMGREADSRAATTRRRASATPISTRSSARTTSSTGSSASTRCRRSRPLRIMPGQAARRRGVRPAPLEGAIWVETIPFNETRDYVKKVLANAMVYGHSVQRQRRRR